MMNLADTARAVRIIKAIDQAIEVFRRSTVKPTVGDIEAETTLTALRTELQNLIDSTKNTRTPW